MSAWTILRQTIARSRRAWLAMTLGITMLYHLGLLASASLSTGHLPNYIRFYDWPANVWRIIRSTPALADMPAIVNDEWLIETGALNYNYGHGIAEWSLAIIPSHVVVALLLSALVATSILLLRRSRDICPLAERGAGATVTGVGALFIGTANITMTWVACCATPTWVVGLSLVGIESSSAFALLPYGGVLLGGGFAVLAATTWWLAWRCVPRPSRKPALLPTASRPGPVKDACASRQIGEPDAYAEPARPGPSQQGTHFDRPRRRHLWPRRQSAHRRRRDLA